MLEPGIDFAIFSLSPGSASLLAMGGVINDSDVFFTDFTGLFAVYATAGSLGLLGDPAGGFIPRPYPPAPGMIDGLDALDIVAVPEPTTLVLVGLALAGAAGYRWRQRRLAARALLVR